MTQANLWFFQIFLSRSIKAYLCPNKINFDGVNVSDGRSEEVISFFWRSVYELQGFLTHSHVQWGHKELIFVMF